MELKIGREREENKYANLSEEEIEKKIEQKQKRVKELNKSISKVSYLKGDTRKEGRKRAKEREDHLKDLRELNERKQELEKKS